MGQSSISTDEKFNLPGQATLEEGSKVFPGEPKIFRGGKGHKEEPPGEKLIGEKNAKNL